MDHSIEILVYKLQDDIDFLDEVPLEVTFDFDKDGSKFSYEITGYLIDGSKVSIHELKKDNPSLNKFIDKAIDKYITNFEEDHYEF